MDNSIKSLVITGDAVEDMNKSRRPIGSRKKRSTKYETEEEDFIEQIKQFSGQKSQVSTPSIEPPKVATIQKVDSLKSEPIKSDPIKSDPTKSDPPKVQLDLPKVERPVFSVNTQPSQENYDGSAKVVLKPAKNTRVKLQPKTVVPTKATEVNTRKARKIRLSVGNLKHRFTRAKRVKDDTENKSFQAIRSYLIEKGAIQEKSKAPEKMLRSMYKDFMLLKDTAL